MNGLQAAPSLQALSGGSRSIGPFALTAQIAAGRRTITFLARSEDTPQPIALRILRKGLDSNAFEARVRAHRAFEGAHPQFEFARFGHESVAHGRAIVGENLATILEHAFRERRPIELDIALGIAMGIAARLARPSDKRVHGDLAPHHILVGYDGQVSLIDATGSQFAERTNNGKRAGYRSPEHVRDEAIVPQSDVFVLGIHLFEMTTGTQLFDIGLDSDQAILEGRLPRPRDLVGDGYPIELQLVLRKLLRPALAGRFMDGASARDALRLVAGARKQTSPQELGEWMRTTFAPRWDSWRSMLNESTIRAIENPRRVSKIRPPSRRVRAGREELTTPAAMVLPNEDTAQVALSREELRTEQARVQMGSAPSTRARKAIVDDLSVPFDSRATIDGELKVRERVPRVLDAVTQRVPNPVSRRTSSTGGTKPIAREATPAVNLAPSRRKTALDERPPLSSRGTSENSPDWLPDSELREIADVLARGHSPAQGLALDLQLASLEAKQPRRDSHLELTRDLLQDQARPVSPDRSDTEIERRGRVEIEPEPTVELLPENVVARVIDKGGVVPLSRRDTAPIGEGAVSPDFSSAPVTAKVREIDVPTQIVRARDPREEEEEPRIGQARIPTMVVRERATGITDPIAIALPTEFEEALISRDDLVIPISDEELAGLGSKRRFVFAALGVLLFLALIAVIASYVLGAIGTAPAPLLGSNVPSTQAVQEVPARVEETPPRDQAPSAPIVEPTQVEPAAEPTVEKTIEKAVEATEPAPVQNPAAETAPAVDHKTDRHSRTARTNTPSSGPVHKTRVALVVRPRNASIAVDGVRIKNDNFVEIGTKSIDLVVSAPGYDDTKVRVRPGTKTINVMLKKTSIELKFDGEPSANR